LGKTIEEFGEEWRYHTETSLLARNRQRQDLQNRQSPDIHSKDRIILILNPVSSRWDKNRLLQRPEDFTRILIVNRSGKILEEISESGFAGVSNRSTLSGPVYVGPIKRPIAFVTENKGNDELRIIDIKKKKNWSGPLSPACRA